MKYFKVKFGFGPDEFISVDEAELPMALRAHISGKKGMFKEGSISGDKIIAITPDFNRALGYNRDYVMKGEDYQELGNARQEHEFLLEEKRYELTNGTKLLN